MLPAPEVCAIVVTYRPDPTVLGHLIEAIAPQVGGLIVVDNGSPPGVAAAIAHRPSVAKCEHLELGDNFGIAFAQNRGIDWARGNGFRYVLLLDQDSEPRADMVEMLLRAHDAATRLGKVSAVGPKYVDRQRGFSSHFVRFGGLKFRRIFCDASADLVETDFLISSGALISLATLDDVGGMDEGLFIDHVDTEWFLRARSMGYRSYGACAAEMLHSLGNDTIRIPLLNRNVPVHSPLRHYYVFRNSLILMRRAYAPRAWRRNDVFRLVGAFCLFMLLAPDRLERLRMIVRGVGDGLRNRAGREDRIPR